MDRHVTDRINLIIAWDHAMLGAVHVDVVKTRQELAGMDALAQLGMVERDVERGLMVAIDNTGHAACATYGPGGPLAGPWTCRRLDFFDGRHFCSSFCLRQRASAWGALVFKCFKLNCFKQRPPQAASSRGQPPG